MNKQDILINMFVTYTLEKSFSVYVPPSVIEYEDEHSIFLSEEFLSETYRANGIEPATVEDLDMEIVK